METKRCVYCHKLQRIDAQICSRCGHAFVQKRSRASKREWTQPSIPPASPHRAGHYSGLHPEDQPYQSNKIAVQHPQESESWHTSLPEPEHIILPVTDPALRRRANIPMQYDDPSAASSLLSKDLHSIEAGNGSCHAGLLQSYSPFRVYSFCSQAAFLWLCC